MQLFYAPDIVLPRYGLGRDESRHAVRVLRLGVGDTLHITDGCGNLHMCRVVEPSPERCIVEVVSTERDFGRLPYRLTMAVAPTKNADRYEWFVEKATEIGVESIAALECERSERRTLKAERVEKIITAAMKQSLKAFRPHFETGAQFADFIAQPFAGRRFIAHCGPALGGAGKRFLASSLRAGEDAVVMIGPEGDFSPAEVAAALAHGFEEITLGSQRLRTETAALMAVAMVATLNGMNESL